MAARDADPPIGIVLTVDQRGSRAAPDAVGELLGALDPWPTRLAFRRTAGDEVQGLVVDPGHLPALVEAVLRDGRWRVGIGIGTLELPLPRDVREARGPAFIHAREGVDAARQAPGHVRVVTGGATHEGVASARALETAIWLWATVLDRRTDRGWEVVDLLDAGHTHEQAARRLGISHSAVTQRARAAGVVEGQRARELVAHLAGVALAGAAPAGAAPAGAAPVRAPEVRA